MYAPAPDGTPQLELIEYHAGWLKSALGNSSLTRYVFFNLQFTNTWREIYSYFFGSPAAAAPRHAGNTDGQADPVRIKASLAAIDAVFRDLPSIVGLPPDRILTLDGFRYPDLAASEIGTYFDLMRQAFCSKAASLGYEVIDRDPDFFRHYVAYAQRFEYPHDGHWNETGHAVAAKAVLASKLVERLIGQQPGP